MQKYEQKYTYQLRVISRLFLVVYLANILLGKDINFYAQKLTEFDASVYSKVHVEQIYICGQGATDKDDFEKLIYANKLVKNTLLFGSFFSCADDTYLYYKQCIDRLVIRNTMPIILVQNGALNRAVYFNSRAPPVLIV